MCHVFQFGPSWAGEGSRTRAALSTLESSHDWFGPREPRGCVTPHAPHHGAGGNWQRACTGDTDTCLLVLPVFPRKTGSRSGRQYARGPLRRIGRIGVARGSVTVYLVPVVVALVGWSGGCPGGAPAAR